MTSLHAALRADSVPAPEVTPSAQVIPPQLPTIEITPSTAEPVVFDESTSELDRSLPPRTALLHVTDAPVDDGQRRFHLSFHLDGRREESLETRSQVDIDISLVRVAERAAWKADHDLIRSWWKELFQLREWIDRLLVSRSDDVRLLVWDTMAASQIPWELYYLDDYEDGKPSGWLGTMIDIVRWTSVLRPDRQDRFTGELTAATGPMLLMQTADVFGTGVRKLAEPHGPPALDHMEGLLAELGRADLRFALLMMHCHGVNATNANEFKLAGITLTDLEYRPMPAVQGSRPVVVLNACNTAKGVPVGPESQVANRSFAELFLRKGAASVVATLGNVGLEHTQEFVYQLLNADGDDRRVARFLRRHRARYAARVAIERVPEEWNYREFFYSFMYVCFGHPDTTLHLQGPAREAE
ncbi:CHAT domain-containing protein [Micromonospora vinacea]|uniref:CHAT domain-containing protein n=1 Tax=Micromonospora vinacea TaxID=709878 RepID=UPI003451C7C0